MNSDQKTYKRHYEDSALILANATDIFAFIDDHVRVMSHMNKPSLMMGGGRGDISFDDGHGRKVGSHIRMSGKAFGITVFVDEVITRYELAVSSLKRDTRDELGREGGFQGCPIKSCASKSAEESRYSSLLFCVAP